jgi:hypothetical protein
LPSRRSLVVRWPALLAGALLLTGACARPRATWVSGSTWRWPLPAAEVAAAADLRGASRIVAVSSMSSDSILVIRGEGTWSGERGETFVVLRRDSRGQLREVWRATAANENLDSTRNGWPVFSLRAGLVVCTLDRLVYRLTSTSGDTAAIDGALRDSLVRRSGVYSWSPQVGTYLLNGAVKAGDGC